MDSCIFIYDAVFIRWFLRREDRRQDALSLARDMHKAIVSIIIGLRIYSCEFGLGVGAPR
jgi:hypothetical protein